MDASDSHETRFKHFYKSANKLRSSGDFARALEKFSGAIELSSKLANQKDERIYDSYLGAARCHYRLGNAREAEEKYQAALSAIQFLEDQSPSTEATLLWELAVLYTDQKRFEEAAQFFKNSILITYRASGPNDKFIADCLWGLSKCFCALKNMDAAEEVIRNALRIYESCGENVSYALITNRKNLASLLIEKRQYQEAFKEIKKSLTLVSEPTAGEAKDFSSLLFRLAWCAQRHGDYEAADQAILKAHRLTRAANGAKSPLTALTALALAHNKSYLRKYAEAEKLLKKSIALLEKDDKETFKHDIAGGLFELGQCYLKQNRIKPAIQILEELLVLHEEDPLFSPELFADTLHTLAHCHELDCNLKRARELNQRSIFVKEQIYGVMHEEVAQSLFQLSSCLRKLDQLPEADFAQVRASEITDALFTAS